ncbi:MAG: ATP-dependent DNA helicase RecG [bacterium]|nr:ATP-dependent DNA helicase RecG [bacterium]
MSPSDPVGQHFRLVDSQHAALKRLGLATIEDLLRHAPARYDVAGDESAITGLIAGAEATIFGTIIQLETRRSWKRKIPVGEAVIRDASGSIKVMWFHQPYLVKKFTEGMFVKAVGTVGGKDGKLYLANPHVEPADPADMGLFGQKAREIASDARRGESDKRVVLSNTTSATQGSRNNADGAISRALFAVYPETRGITSLWFRHALKRVFEAGALALLDDPIPDNVRTHYHLPDLSTALIWLHTPEKLSQAEVARKRFAFEEIFTIQVARARERRDNDAQSAFPIHNSEEHAKTFLSTIPFPPTGAQGRAIAEILGNFRAPHPMARLLEGDVGSGKTLVAATAAYTVVKSRPPGRESGTLQVAYMAPTEILAAQHFQSFIEYFSHLPINIALITGSGCKKFPSKVSRGKATDISRAQLLKWVASGEIAMLVGTHALIQKSVQFQHLALCIVDEQHRFGTRQRKALAKKGDASPHFLSMTATPIPRTLALTLYGDLDISLLDELPPGRAKITTKIVKPSERTHAYEIVRKELGKGRQAFVVCPRIEEPDPAKINALQAKSAKAEAARLKAEVFQTYEVGLLHGAMKPSEKDDVMERFVAGEIHVLVATSVVEVGVNVPNATAIMIEGAERFGLAQLHQLRGRVMRSSHPPICFLLTDSKSDASLKRLRALEKSDDGFKLAEADLENRGAGDLFGRSQWGVTDLGMEALKNPRLIKAARDEAQALVARDSALSHYPALAARVASAAEELHNE